MEGAPTLLNVKRLDSITLDADDKTYFTKEGYLIDHPILTSCGIFEYSNPDGSIRRELRLPEHVFNEKSLKTYKGKPIIITHEAGVVDKDNVADEQIGTILSEGYRDGDDVRAEIVIHDTEEMKKSNLKELSLGYNLDLIEKPGEWEGEPYDAIQTNITINHLALVANARAGEQARLNIDGSDEPELKGGKSMAKDKVSGVMTADEIEKAVEAYKARKSDRMVEDSEPETDPKEDMPAMDEGTSTEEPQDDSKDEGKTPEDIAELVKSNRDRRDAEEEPKDMKSAMGVIARQDEDIDMLLAALEKLLAEYKNDEDDTETDGCDPEKKDGADDESKSLNADSMDEIIRQRLNICRVGDKLNLDGLENKSILAGKKAIIAKVLPGMRLDGKSGAYIDAAYDMAVSEVNKRKDVDYQKKQMFNGRRADSSNTSMAASARQRMIEREGGNK